MGTFQLIFTAHRRNVKRKDTKKVLDYFDFENRTIEKILDEIFENFIKTMNTLEKLLLKSP